MEMEKEPESEPVLQLLGSIAARTVSKVVYAILQLQCA